MNLVELKSKIVNNDISNLLIFTGPETGVMNTFINNIINKLKYPCNKSNSVQDVIQLCSGNSFFKSKKIFIVIDDNDFLKADKAWDNIRSILKDNILILKYHTFDSRLSFWKKFEQDTVIFDYLHPDVLCKHLNKEYNLELENCKYLIDNIGNDYIKCQLELDKIKSLAQAKNIDINTAFERSKNTNILCMDNNTNLTDFIEAILVKNYEKMFIFYRDLQQSGEPIVKIVNLLYNSFKNVLIAQTISNPRNIQQNTGLNYYSYQKAKEFVGYYSNIEIEDLLYKLMKIEQGIKTGSIDQDISIDYFLTCL